MQSTGEKYSLQSLRKPFSGTSPMKKENDVKSYRLERDLAMGSKQGTQETLLVKGKIEQNLWSSFGFSF